MSSRSLSTLIAAPLLCVVGVVNAQTSAECLPSKPNVLLVIADDIGLDASPCHDVGDSRITMPTLASLCEQGLVFDNAYAAPECSPTRATLLTGRYGLRTGVGAAIPRTGGGGLSAEETSLRYPAVAVGGRILE